MVASTPSLHPLGGRCWDQAQQVLHLALEPGLHYQVPLLGPSVASGCQGSEGVVLSSVPNTVLLCLGDLPGRDISCLGPDQGSRSGPEWSALWLWTPGHSCSAGEAHADCKSFLGSHAMALGVGTIAPTEAKLGPWSQHQWARRHGRL